MSQSGNSELNTKYMNKVQREMSKPAQEEQKMESQDLNASFSDNSETEREKTSVRRPTGLDDRKPKNYKRRKSVPSWQPLK